MPECFPVPDEEDGAHEEDGEGEKPAQQPTPEPALGPVPGQRRLRLLCYGDSLTAGFHDRFRFSPYGSVLQEMLAPDFDVEIWVCGLSSFSTGRMVRELAAQRVRDGVGRLGKGLGAILAESSSRPFDLVLLMAGTNDLSLLPSSKRAQGQVVRSCDHLKALHAVCHEHKVPTVALSVLPSAITALETVSDLKKDYKRRWKQLNEQLEAWATGSEAREEGVVQFVDTQQLVPFSEDSGHWADDGLHLSAEGSRLLGRGLSSQLAPLLLRLLDGSLQAPRPDTLAD